MSTRPVALVAGGSRGLGLLIARELGRRGFQPVLWARDAAELDRAVLALKDDGIDAAAMVCDVSDHELVEQQVGRIEDELGPIEVAVHVAGVIQVGPLSSLTRQHFEQAIDIMQWGPINLALAVVPGMRARGRGRFGTIASIGGLVSVPHLLPYSTAKFGAVGFTNGLRAELAGTGVTATTVAPGLMRTGSHLKAEFTGDAAAEYAWFAPGASMPFVSMDAERAAAKIVSGDPERAEHRHPHSPRQGGGQDPGRRAGDHRRGDGSGRSPAAGRARRADGDHRGPRRAPAAGLEARRTAHHLGQPGRGAQQRRRRLDAAVGDGGDRRSVGRRGPQPFPDRGASGARRGQQVQDEVVVLVGSPGSRVRGSRPRGRAPRPPSSGTREHAHASARAAARRRRRGGRRPGP